MYGRRPIRFVRMRKMNSDEMREFIPRKKRVWVWFNWCSINVFGVSVNQVKWEGVSQ